MTIDKTVYNYSPITFEYTGTGEGDVTDLEPDVLIVPGHATIIAPPDTGANQVAVFHPDTIPQVWSVEQDHRGETRYSTTDGAMISIDEIGPLPSNTTEQARPDSTYVWNQNQNTWVLNPALVAAANNAIVYAEMSDIDINSIAPIREWLAGQPGVSSAITTLETQYINKKAELDLSYED